MAPEIYRPIIVADTVLICIGLKKVCTPIYQVANSCRTRQVQSEEWIAEHKSNNETKAKKLPGSTSTGDAGGSWPSNPELLVESDPCGPELWMRRGGAATEGTRSPVRGFTSCMFGLAVQCDAFFSGGVLLSASSRLVTLAYHIPYMSGRLSLALWSSPLGHGRSPCHV